MKSRVDTLYPLTQNQEALLFHALSVPQDTGFIQVKCTINGELDEQRFKKAWSDGFSRHEMLRASVHWQDIEKPVIIIHKHVDLVWYFQNLSSLSKEDQSARIANFKKTDRNLKFDLAKPPTSRVALFRLKADNHFLLWSCHHLLLDGWSSSVILRDVLSYYHSIGSSNLSIPLSSYSTYLKELRSDDQEMARSYWQKRLKGIKRNVLSNNNGFAANGNEVFEEQILLLSPSSTSEISAFIREHRLTINTLVTGIWALLSAKLNGVFDVTFGSTTSGRSVNIPGIENMAGMFMNVIPIRVMVDEHLPFDQWINDIQNHQIAQQPFENVSLTQIIDWIKLDKNGPIFDSLLIVGNYPLDLSGDEISILDFESDLTTTYPLTVVIRPGDQLRLQLKYNVAVVSKELSKGLITELKKLLENLRNFDSVASVMDSIDLKSNLKPVQSSVFDQGTIEQSEEMDSGNVVENRILQMWKSAMNLSVIDCEDDFFRLGGKSLVAAQIISTVNKEFDMKLTPTVLLQYPTVRLLSQKITGIGSVESSSRILGLNIDGSQRPIFCIPPGGSSALFYRMLAENMGKDYPVYSILPLILEELESEEVTVEQIATNCIGELKQIQPRGPYNLLGFCLSNVVILEMAHQLIRSGESIALLSVIDPSSFYDPVKHTLEPSRDQRIRRFISIILKVDLKEILTSVSHRLKLMTKKWRRTVGRKEVRDFRRMEMMLLVAAMNYDWRNYPGRISFFRQFRDLSSPHIMTYGWETIIGGESEEVVIDAHHKGMLVNPAVKELAVQLRKMLGNKQPVNHE